LGKIIHPKITFNRSELAGAFGDIGTDFPLLVALILATGLHAPGVLIVFGLLQIITGLVYRMPMPVQPLKAMATLVIAQKIGGDILLGAGLAIGVCMFFLSVTGLLQKLSTFIPKSVVRGIQFGLGLSLCSLALKEYILKSDFAGYLLATLSFIIVLFFIKNKRFPAAIIVIFIGLLYAFLFKLHITDFTRLIGVNWPPIGVPSLTHIVQGFLLLSLPQIPLSLGNSILATQQSCKDYFPERTDISVTKLGFSYAGMNLLAPFLGGIPVCHGAGGLVGHYAFGGRTGGSVVIYGSMYLVLGLFFGNGFNSIIQLFPLPVLGVILLFEGLSLMQLIIDVGSDKKSFTIALLTGILAFGLPYGYLFALVLGTLFFYGSAKIDWLKD
jgi:MFS superfamily sulfate permease-like transporter